MYYAIAASTSRVLGQVSSLDTAQPEQGNRYNWVILIMGIKGVADEPPACAAAATAVERTSRPRKPSKFGHSLPHHSPFHFPD